MDNSKKILVTGAAGFIGSCMVQYLNEQGFTRLILADDFGVEEKRENWEQKEFEDIIERHSLLNWLNDHQPELSAVIHLGARTDTTEFNYAIHEELNLEYSKDLWNYCCINSIPFIYASSAATYGNGEFGYKDDHELINQLAPLNPYGISKNEFDKWALKQENQPPYWVGLKFFNVYGPNEAHKERMASVIWHSFNQILEHGVVQLFKSHKEGFKDGEQLRDFIYVKDVIAVIEWLFERMVNNTWSADRNGIYNLGTGKARTFNDLATATFHALNRPVNIKYVDMPKDIREKYQYFTEAIMDKLGKAGYSESFYSLEEGVADYVANYLVPKTYY